MQETVQSFSIAGKHFVSGLVWEFPLDRSLITEKKKSLRQEFQYFCQYKLGKHNVQFGLVPKENSQVCDVGYSSFAATMARNINMPYWIGVFKVSPVLYSLVAVRDGFIMAGKDIVGDADRVWLVFNELIDTMAEMGEVFEQIFVPKEWDVPAGNVINIREFLGDKKRRANLVKMSTLSGSNISQANIRYCIQAGIGCAILAIGYMGYSYYQHKKEENKQEIIMRTKILPPPQEWEYMPRVNAQIKYWQQMVDNLPLIFEGWELSNVRFTTGEMTFSYVRNEMLSADSFGKKASAYFGGRLTFDKEGNTATIVKSFKPISDENTEILLNNKDVNIKFYSWLQHTDIENISFEKTSVALPPLPTTTDSSLIYKWGEIDWEKYKWKMDIPVDIAPNIVFQGIEPLSGLRLSAMYCDDIRTNGWHLEGYFYASK